jgi:hypothetical protein
MMAFIHHRRYDCCGDHDDRASYNFFILKLIFLVYSYRRLGFDCFLTLHGER